ncbi:MAG: DUF1566 domain-containing protein, partial [Sphingobacteriia bacterium]|nr:DUF1566 domain-containing protein [Sphingobacteriia bacterium]
AKHWVRDADARYLRLERDAARALYQQAAIWPLYAYLAIRDSGVALERLVLATPDRELPIEMPAPSDLIGGRYWDQRDGTVRDTQTGLQWMRCALGQRWDGRTCVGDGGLWAWKDLTAVVDAFNQESGCGGQADWRIPTIDELKSLTSRSGTYPQPPDRAVFPKASRNCETGFWSSSPAIDDPGAAWYSFETAEHPLARGHVGHLRLVRGRGRDHPAVHAGSQQVKRPLSKRSDQARSDGRQCHDSPKIVPDLDRDPFETVEEWATRTGLAERRWYVGEGELQKARYDLATGRFPLRLRSVPMWAMRWLPDPDVHSLRLERDAARALYQQAAIWPLYAYLAIRDSGVAFERLVLATPDRELPVEEPAAEAVTGKTIQMSRRGPKPPTSEGFLNLGDGTILDTRTGLQWMRCALGQTWDGQTCVGKAHELAWHDLTAEATAFNKRGGYGGQADWRVPTIDELKTITDRCGREARREVFPEPDPYHDWFWSASPYPDDPRYASKIMFGIGQIGNHPKDSEYYVRLVRGGQ